MSGNRKGGLESIQVAAGLVFRGGRLLVAQRRPTDSLGGLWEFPGGKREPNESFEACLHRELYEELGIEVSVGQLLQQVDYTYPERCVHLRFFRCAWTRHEPRALGCDRFAWITRDELGQYLFPPADAPLVNRLQREAELWR